VILSILTCLHASIQACRSNIETHRSGSPFDGRTLTGCSTGPCCLELRGACRPLKLSNLLSHTQLILSLAFQALASQVRQSPMSVSADVAVGLLDALGASLRGMPPTGMGADGSRSPHAAMGVLNRSHREEIYQNSS